MATDIIPTMECILCYAKTHADACPKASCIAQGAFDALCRQGVSLSQFSCLMNKIQGICGSLDEIGKNSVEDSTQRSLSTLLQSRKNIRDYILQAVSLIDHVVEETTGVLTSLESMQESIDLNLISELKATLKNELELHKIKQTQLLKIKQNLHCSSAMTHPGSQFGLKLFEDIKLHHDGRVLLWDKLGEDWVFPDELHPCRKIPGGPWGKMFHDMTPGYFFTQQPLDVMEWRHAAPVKRYLQRIKTAHAAMLPGIRQSPISVRRQILRKNKRLAQGSGLEYPVNDFAGLQKFTVHVDVSAMVNEPFNVKADNDSMSLADLNAVVMELQAGPVRQGRFQEQEKLIYDIP